jgi:hypothetical protein
MRPHALSALLLGLTVLASTARPAPPRDAHALLVGCTVYKNHPGLRELYGPKNDVKIWADLLTDPKGFAFPKENVTTLAAWPDNEKLRPTRANIVKGFENLICKAKEGTQVVIVLSGHGVQVPIPSTQKDPLDPKNPEPDGLDEVFLPADVQEWTEKDGLKGGILDDEIGAWLDKLRAGGAHVLIVFDCCHAGTMTRSGTPTKEGIREINRVASHDDLKIDRKAVDAAVERARKAVDEAKKAGRPVPGEAVLKPVKGGKGSVVAFSAAQAFEQAPELPFPEDADALPENYYGALSWTMVQALKNRKLPLNYAELEHLVGASYRATRGTRPPTPFAEASPSVAIGRQVLGQKVWPARPAIYLQKEKGRLKINAGLLLGVTPGSVLSVHPPPGDKRPPATVLGHVRVRSANPTSATVFAVKREGGAWAASKDDKAPESARCEVVERDFGDMRVKLYSSDDRVAKALKALKKGVASMLLSVPKEEQADWALRVVSPAAAKKEYGLAGLEGDHVVLVHGEGRKRLAGEQARHEARKVYAAYPLADSKGLVEALERDLHKAFTWENLWRVAAGVNSSDGGETHGLVVETLLLKEKADKAGTPLRGGVIRDGQWTMWRAKNGGSRPLWVTALYLDANLGINVFFSGSIDAGKEVPLGKAQADTEHGKCAGLEGVVIFAIPTGPGARLPQLDALKQKPLSLPDKRSGPRGKLTPFERLLNRAALGTSGTRGFDLRVSSTPAIISRSWLVLP